MSKRDTESHKHLVASRQPAPSPLCKFRMRLVSTCAARVALSNPDRVSLRQEAESGLVLVLLASLEPIVEMYCVRDARAPRHGVNRAFLFIELSRATRLVLRIDPC